MAPRVTVVIPTYQRRDLVVVAVESALAQTFRDFDVIVVDDGSTDGTGDALARFGGRVTYVWQQNAGVSAARNRALALSAAPLVAFLDADDRWLPDHLEVLVAVLDRLPEAVLVTASPRHVIGGRAGPGRARLVDAFEPMLFANCVGYPSCIVARRAAIDAAGAFDPRMLAGEDGDLFLRMSVDGPFAFLQRRTMVKGYTAGLKDWARRTGRMAATMERRVAKARDLVERRGDEGRVAATNGALAWAAALRAIGEGDEHRAADALAQACRLLPALSRAGELVEERVAMLPGSDDRATQVRHLTTAAQAWPEAAADTALFLRLSALLLAVRGADGRQARELLAGWPLRATPRALWRAAPGLARRAVRTRDARRHRLDDGVDLDLRLSAVTA